MSKIQKALNRASSEGRLVVFERRTGGVPGRDLVPTSTELELRARSTAAIAQMRETKLRSKAELAEAGIIAPELEENPTVKAFRELRTKILQRTGGRNCSVMVTGVTSRAGATFAAVNLSAAFAFDASKTAVLIDCNLRNPRLQSLFGKERASGLTDYLESPSMDLAEIIHPVGVERLRVIPAGGRREVPAEYFTSIKMKRLLYEVTTRYPARFIILDGPPMTASADTQILATLCDFTILVVPYGAVTPAQLEACVKDIDPEKLLGVVFNNEPRLPPLGRTRG